MAMASVAQSEEAGAAVQNEARLWLLAVQTTQCGLYSYLSARKSFHVFSTCISPMQMATASVAQSEEAGAAVQDEARLRLLAHIYSNQVAHLTTGMRIGAGSFTDCTA